MSDQQHVCDSGLLGPSECSACRLGVPRGAAAMGAVGVLDGCGGGLSSSTHNANAAASSLSSLSLSSSARLGPMSPNGGGAGSSARRNLPPVMTGLPVTESESDDGTLSELSSTVAGTRGPSASAAGMLSSPNSNTNRHTNNSNMAFPVATSGCSTVTSSSGGGAFPTQQLAALGGCSKEDNGETPLAAAPPPTAVCWWPEPPLVTDFRRHAKYLTTCYSICSYTVSTRRLCGVIAFSTAMYFIHRFVYCHGTEVSGRWGAVSRIDPATLSAAAVFLATKAENFKVKLSSIVEIVFECSATDTDRHALYKLMTLQVEVMLLSTLSGSLTIIHPFAALTAMAPEGTAVGQLVNKLYSYTVMTPLALYYEHHQIAMALVAIVADNLDAQQKRGGGGADNAATDNAAIEGGDATSSPSSADGPHRRQFAGHIAKLSAEARCATELALIEALVAKGKGCGLATLDAVVEQRLAILRNLKKASSRKSSVGGVAAAAAAAATPPSTPLTHRPVVTTATITAL